MCKPAPLRCAGLHNSLPVIGHLYFNKLTKLNIQFLNTGKERDSDNGLEVSQSTYPFKALGKNMVGENTYLKFENHF